MNQRLASESRASEICSDAHRPNVTARSTSQNDLTTIQARGVFFCTGVGQLGLQFSLVIRELSI